MPLIAAVRQVFAPDGPLVRDLPGFVPRAGQTDMALAVARTVQGGGALVVEAGTGVGKTFAYLAPALLSGARVLVSTATKALQDQLFLRDIPRLAAAKRGISRKKSWSCKALVAVDTSTRAPLSSAGAK